MPLQRVSLCFLVLIAGVSCRSEPSAPPPPERAPVEGFEVVRSWPHDPRAFTQGLVFHQGRLYEGTGMPGRSNLREVELETGTVLRQTRLEPQYFGEGIALRGNRLYQLTWRSQVGFVYDATTFERLGQFTYPTEGWGLTGDGDSLIMSDGTSTLRFLDPSSFALRRTVKVTENGHDISQLNELEFVRGEIYANVWMTQRIVRIDPATGHVKGWIDLTGLLRPEERTGDEDVLNGIAYDAASDRLLVTGKYWPRLFQIRVVPR
ncbi:MAG: glutaminyl-peptide cyclotransferase [Cystobacter sp.]